MGGGNSRPPGGPERQRIEIPKEVVEAAVAQAYPLVRALAAGDLPDDKVQHMVEAAVVDDIRFSEIVKHVVDNPTSLDAFLLEFHKVSPLVGVDDTKLDGKLAAPAFIEQCEDFHERMSWLIVMCILMCVPARALLYLEGYRPKIILTKRVKPESEETAEDVS